MAADPSSEPRCIVLLATQRSGTGALGSILDQHDQIQYLGEVFHDNTTDPSRNYFPFLTRLAQEEPEKILPQNGKERFARFIDHLCTTVSKDVFVIDIKYRSMHHFNQAWHGFTQPPYLFQLLAEAGIPVLHLVRRNVLKTYLSGRLAEANKIWHMTSDQSQSVQSIEVDADAIGRRISGLSYEIDIARRNLSGHAGVLEICYEELFDDQGRFSLDSASELGRFLNVGPFLNRRPAFVKQTGDTLKSVIQNYDEVEAALSETPYSWMLAG